jgi:hypothetical protein
MKKIAIAAGALAAMAVVPAAAQAQSYDPYYGGGYYSDQRDRQVGGAVIGGILGAFAGSAVAGRGDRTEGALIGGALGAVVGSQVAKSGDHDRYGYGYSHSYPAYGYAQPSYGYAQPSYGYGYAPTYRHGRRVYTAQPYYGGYGY